MLTLSDIVEIFHECGVHWVQIFPVYHIKSSADARILPLDAGVDQFEYEAKHGPKPNPAIRFDRDVYYAYDIVGLIPGADANLPIMKHANRLRQQNHPKIITPKPPSNAQRVKTQSRRVAGKIKRILLTPQ